MAGFLLFCQVFSKDERPAWLLNDYAGKYADRPEGRRFLADLEEARRRAFDRIERRLGIPAEDDGAIRIEVVDAEPASGKGGKGAAEEAVRVEERERDGKADRVVTLTMESLMSGEAELRSSLSRGVAEALLLSRFDKDQRKKIPPWVLTGLALYAAGTEEGDAVAAEILAERRKPPETLISDLEGRHGDDSLAQDFWAFLYLERQCGVAGVRRFARAFWDGAAYDEALMKETGLAWGEILKGMNADARKRLAALCAGGDAFKDLAKKAAHAAGPEALTLAGEIGTLAEKHKDAYWRPRARYLQARCFEEAGKVSEAMGIYREILGDKPPFGDHVADARLRLARILRARRAVAEAKPLFERLALDHFHERFAGTCFWELAAIAAEEKDEPARERWLRKLVDRFPESDKGKQAAKMLKELDKK